MCIDSTDKINQINETTVTIDPNFTIKDLTFVHDMIGAETKKIVRRECWKKSENKEDSLEVHFKLINY